ncbi:MAG: hypothetical protein ACK40K_03230, partial [Raineya sp.]
MSTTQEKYFPNTTKHPKNRVLSEDFRKSQNFYESDLILSHYLQKYISAEARSYMQNKWEELGSNAAQKMDALSLFADKYPPQLIKRNHLGETLNHIQFHPAYHTLTQMAIGS